MGTAVKSQELKREAEGAEVAAENAENMALAKSKALKDATLQTGELKKQMAATKAKKDALAEVKTKSRKDTIADEQKLKKARHEAKQVATKSRLLVGEAAKQKTKEDKAKGVLKEALNLSARTKRRVKKLTVRSKKWQAEELEANPPNAIQ